MRTPSSDRIIRSLVGSVAAALAMGCGDSLSPAGVAGTYVLRTIDGDSLPTTPAISGPRTDYTIVVVADTLRLAPDGSGMLVTIEDIVHEGSGGEVERVRVDAALHFSTSDGRIEITFVCPPNALMNCAPGPHMTARLASDGLSVSRPSGKVVNQLRYVNLDELEGS